MTPQQLQQAVEALPRFFADAAAPEVMLPSPIGAWVLLSDVLSALQQQPEPVAIWQSSMNKPHEGAWMDCSESNARAAEKYGYKARVLYTAPALQQQEGKGESAERFQFVLSACRDAQDTASRYGMALNTIAQWPCGEQDDMQSANMRAVARDCLLGSAQQEKASDAYEVVGGFLSEKRINGDTRWQQVSKRYEDDADVVKLYRAVSPSAAVQQEAGSDAARDVLAERARQVGAEGWTAAHDDEHSDGAMAVATACYALASEHVFQLGKVDFPELWRWTGWASQWWKPKDKRRNLIRAAALLLAEIERLDRAAAPTQQPPSGSDGAALPETQQEKKA